MKQRKLNKRKGFTLVELLVVIAILAVLATVSVVGYTSFTKKAKVSNDENLVAQLNTALKADEVTDGKPATPTEMLEVMEENGFKVENLTPTTSKYNIVWNQEKNEFALLDEKNNTVFGEVSKDTYKNWKFTETYVEDGYSVYLKDGFTENSLEVSTGLDVGNNENINVNYTSTVGQEVTIRTNGGTFDVNADTDTVYHYGSSSKVTITAVAGNSYHEFGNTNAIVVAKGRVVVEKVATVETVIANPSTNSKVDVSVPETSNTKVYSSDETVNVTGTTLEKVDNVTDYIKGVTEFAGGAGTESHPYLVSTKEQAMNIENNKGYFTLVNDIVVEDEIYMFGKTYVIDLNGHSIKLEYADNVKPNNGGVFNISGKNSKSSLGSLTINDSSEKQTGKVIGSDKTYSNKVTSAVRVGKYGKLIINGGHFYGMSNSTSCIYVYTTRASSTKSTVIINGGIFEVASPYNGTYYVLNHEDSNTTGCTIIVNGGKFREYNPGVTSVDPVNAYTGKISLGEGCTTKEEKNDGSTYYIVSKQN